MKMKIRIGIILGSIFLLITITLSPIGGWLRNRLSTSSDVTAMKKLDKKEFNATINDPIAMYQHGIESFRKKDYVSAYVWYKLSSEKIQAWADATDGKIGENRFNDTYLVMDVFKVKNEVNTNYPIIYNLLSNQQRQLAEVELRNRRQEITGMDK